MGLRQKVQREMLASSLPDDLRQEFHRLSEWAQAVGEKFGPRVTLRLVDAASIEGFFTSLRRWVHRYPAFTVGRRRYVGTDFGQVDELISAELGASPRHSQMTTPGTSEKGG